MSASPRHRGSLMNRYAEGCMAAHLYHACDDISPATVRRLEKVTLACAEVDSGAVI
jgi:hypothetical protein